jgi:glycine/D-amino acid oxidase-like deaminating enzyme
VFGPERGARLTASTGAAPDLVFGLIARHKIDCQPVRAGWIQGAHAPPALAAIQRRAEQWARRGAPVEILSAAAVRERLGAALYCGGLIDKRAGTIQPLAYVRGLARAAQEAGARLFTRSAARSLQRSGGAWRVATAAGAVTAEHVVIATDSYSDALWPGLARSILTVQSIQLATRPLGHNLASRILAGGECVSETRKIAFYFRRDPAGRFLIGGRGPTRDHEQPSMFAALERSLTRLFPEIDLGELEYRWSGRIGMTIDHLPHLHEPAPGLHIGLGYNGRGIAMASLMGRILADRVNGRDTELPVTRLAPLRWHGVRQPLMTAAIAYYRFKDRIGLAS